MFFKALFHTTDNGAYFTIESVRAFVALLHLQEKHMNLEEGWLVLKE